MACWWATWLYRSWRREMGRWIGCYSISTGSGGKLLLLLLLLLFSFWVLSLILCRLTPPMMLVLLVYTAYFQYWGSGPQWPQRSPDHAVCSSYWWRNLIYIQNFFPLSEEVKLNLEWGSYILTIVWRGKTWNRVLIFLLLYEGVKLRMRFLYSYCCMKG